MTDNMFWGFLLTRSGHNNYWVDMPLMFNNDLTPHPRLVRHAPLDPSPGRARADRPR